MGGRDGGGAAAPAFREIAETVLPEMNVPRDLESGPTVAEAEEIPESPDAGDMSEAPVIPQSGGPKMNDGSVERPKAALPKADAINRPKEKLSVPARANKARDANPKQKEKVIESPTKQIKNKSSSARMEYRT